MLLPYTYVPHQIEKMQEFIDFIFFEVWCKAPEKGDFSLDLFDGKAELKEVIEAFHYSDAKGADFFNGNVEAIYDLFAQLTPVEINKFQQWYKANNDIEKICANDPTVHIARYADIKVTHPILSKQLAEFFKGLYSDDFLGLAALRKKIGQIKDHYHEFAKTNKGRICPFCGISRMLGVYHSKREAYDHYLPKGIYPFNSINFRNLVPACHHCNSNYKLSQDPAFMPKDPVGVSRRRKLFYPYSAPVEKIKVSIDLSRLDDLSKLDYYHDENLEPSNIQLSFGPSTINEEIESWKDIYGIEERYLAECCDFAKYWLEEMRIACEESNTEPVDELNKQRKVSEKYPLEDSRFLRVAFLEECHRLGIWNSAK